MARRTTQAAAVALAAALAGCSNKLPDAQPLVKRAALQSFTDCASLEDYIEDNAVLDMRSQLELQRDGYGGGWRGFGGPEKMAADAAAPNAAGGGKANSAAPSAYTTTNTQVAGVDEADFVKNDGTRIFVLSGNKLYSTLSWPASALALQGSLELEGHPREMFLDGDTVVVFSAVYQSYPLDSGNGGGAVGEAAEPGYIGSPWYGYTNATKVTVVDVSNLAQPVAARAWYLPGDYANSRRVGQSVRLVLRDNFRWPSAVKWWVDWEEGLENDQPKLRAKYDALIAQNESTIRSAALSDWLPEGKLTQPDGSQVTLPYACTDFAHVNAPTRNGLVTVATLDLNNPQPSLQRVSVVGEVGEIFASHTNLYVTNRHWWWWPAPGQADHTYLHKFDISQPDTTTYVASGGVAGHIVDQFSMDEDAAGFFRIATTTTSRVADVLNPLNTWGILETTNRVSVMGENAGELVLVGQTPEMAKGERIYSSRFVGTKGYVVTFKQVDPLFTIDLTNPQAPTVVGELKVPGFSSYIHPLGPNHLLTIGTYIPENSTNWQERALQLSIFDVSNFAAPVQTHNHLVGTASSWSEAAYDHRAFNHFPAKGLLAIPFFDWSYSAANYWDSFLSELRVFGVDAQAGFTVKGSLSLSDLYRDYGYNSWSWYWSPEVRRSVMADDYVYAISDAGIRVAHVGSLSTPLATVKFDGVSTKP
ncbi:MAG: beta-propeller domain-containing protein [Deltaproteobacteria bacterium]|nr:beta-propeller domain-containing protein [Deltaproteobacteria bacterium]